MPRRQTILVSPLVSLVAMGCAWQSPRIAGTRRPSRTGRHRTSSARPRTRSRFPPEAMDELLRLWEGQSAEARHTRGRHLPYRPRHAPGAMRPSSSATPPSRAPIWPTSTIAKSRLKAQPDPKVKNKMVFAPVQKNGQLVSKPFETILCTGTEVWHYRSDVTRLIIWALNNEARKKALDEGPLPFLFRMKAGDAKQRYQMTLRLQDKKSSLVMILPRMKEDKDVFSTAWVYARSRVSVADADRAHLAGQSEAAGFPTFEAHRQCQGRGEPKVLRRRQAEQALDRRDQPFRPRRSPRRRQTCSPRGRSQGCPAPRSRPRCDPALNDLA